MITSAHVPVREYSRGGGANERIVGRARSPTRHRAGHRRFAGLAGPLLPTRSGARARRRGWTPARAAGASRGRRNLAGPT